MTSDSASHVLPMGESLFCLECGYDLRGLGTRHRCPECGAAVLDSIRARTLAHWPVRWRRRLRWGLLVLALGLLLGALWMAAWGTLLLLSGYFDTTAPFRWIDPATQRAISRAYEMTSFIVPAGLIVIGCLILTFSAPTRGALPDADRRRRIARSLAVATGIGVSIGAATTQVASHDGLRAAIYLLILVIATQCAWYLGGYLGLLAGHLPDPWLARRIRHRRVLVLISAGLSVSLLRIAFPRMVWSLADNLGDRWDLGDPWWGIAMAWMDVLAITWIVAMVATALATAPLLLELRRAVPPREPPNQAMRETE